MSEQLSANLPVRMTGRTKDEITQDFKKRCRTAAENILAIGFDLIEMKQLLDHGAWLKWLEDVEWSERTAQNYMRVARAWDEKPNLIQMGYTKTVAVLAGPAELQEQAEAGELDGKSAAEIRRLSKELKKEQDARKAAEDGAKEAGQKLLEAEARLSEKPKEIIVEKAPDDYELIKKQLKLAEDAAEEAEQRAAEAVRQAMDEEPQRYDGPSVIAFVEAVNEFSGRVSALPYAADWLRKLGPDDRRSVELFTNSVWHWAEKMLKAIEESGRLMVIPAEGAVSYE